MSRIVLPAEAFGLSDEHRSFQAALRAFFARVAPPEVITELDEAEQYPASILAAFNELDLWALAVPTAFGGAEADPLAQCLAAEEVQRAGACLAYAYLPTAAFCAPAIARFGTAEQQAALLPGIASGQLRFAMALTEPDAGSDLMSVSTRAVRDGDDWRLQGQKVFTTGADTCDYLLVLVRTDDAAPRGRGLSTFLVGRETPGLTIRPLKKLAGQATHTCEVFIDDVVVSDRDRLGDPGRGAAIVLSQLEGDRMLTAAQSLGTAQGAFDLALTYARTRHQFGRAIIEHQAIGHLLADMEIAVDSARLMTWRVAELMREGRPCGREAAAAKVLASETATRVAAQAMQVFGGASYLIESGVERYYREAKIQEIFAGTNQILRNIIAAGLAS